MKKLAALFLFFLSTTALAAQPPPAFTLNTDVRLQAADEDSGGSNAGAGATEINVRLNAPLGMNNFFYSEARAVGDLGRLGFETADTGSLSNGKSFLEWRQAYAQFGNLGNQPFYIRAGRQRMQDSYGLLWNGDLDALRVGYDTTVFKGFIAAGQNLSSYNTSIGALPGNNKDIARFLAEGSWQYYYDHFFETRLLMQDDHSGTTPIGATESNDNLNDTDGRLLWAGLRASGKIPSFLPEAGKMSYRADLIGLTGHENQNTTAVATPTTMLVTGMNRDHVNGWAFDGAVDIPLPVAGKNPPALHLGYAHGSTDYRQSDLSGNFSKTGELTENTDNYGVVLRPDLADIHIFSGGVTKPVMNFGNIGLIYRYYRLSSPATSAIGGVPTGLNGTDRDLGQALDVLFNLDMMKELNIFSKNAQGLSLRTALGLFREGAAYGPDEGRCVARGLVEVKVSF